MTTSTACAAPQEERPPLPAQEEAGSVHVAVLAVARWHDYVDALQPYFDLTADDALGQVLRISQLSSADELRRTSVQLTAGAGGAKPDVPTAAGPQTAAPKAPRGTTRHSPPASPRPTRSEAANPWPG